MTMRKLLLLALLALTFALTACDGGGDNSTTSQAVPANAIEISIIYAPESRDYMQTIIPAFNESYARGVNPVTGQALASGERPIFITGKDGSSGTVMQGIVNAITTPNSQNIATPTMFQPSVSHWLALG